MQSSQTYTRSHGLYPTRWCDLFDLSSWAQGGWMLLDLPGAPCDVTQPQMRNMSQRLRKAQECAAAGGKYGLLQAVLLSMDSQPDSPAHWLRQSVALEACSKVLLSAAHEAQVDLGAARAAYQQLTLAEQRLWRQLQAARIQLKRRCNMDLGSAGAYLPDLTNTANILAGVTGEASLLAHETMYQLMFTRRWDLACRGIKRYCSVEDPDNPPSMQAAYNWALAAYFHHGKDHAETKKALAATKAADPRAWVPMLLAGLTYPPLSMPPASVPCSKMEAAGYAYHFGSLWATSASQQLDGSKYGVRKYYTSLSAPLQWLLDAHGIDVPAPEVQGDLAPLRQLACGNPWAAFSGRGVEAACSTAGRSRWREWYEMLGVARTLREMVVLMLSMATLTMNLPPISAAPQLWQGLATRLGHNAVSGVASDLKLLTGCIADNISEAIYTYCGNHDSAVTMADSRGFCIDELDDLQALLADLQIATARWKWQLGDAAAAQQHCNLEGPLRLNTIQSVMNTVSSSCPPWPEELGNVISADQLPPDALRPIHDLAAFLGQEAQQRRRSDSQPFVLEEEQHLYQLFPHFLTHLVGQVRGREASLVIEPKAAHSLDKTRQPVSGVYLIDAPYGKKQVFGWRLPGDVDDAASYQGLVQAAKQRGVTDPDLLQYSAGVEPLGWGMSAAGSGGTSDSTSAGPRRRLQAKRRQAGAGGSSSTTSSTPSTNGAHATHPNISNSGPGQQPAGGMPPVVDTPAVRITLGFLAAAAPAAARAAGDGAGTRDGANRHGASSSTSSSNNSSSGRSTSSSGSNNSSSGRSTSNTSDTSSRRTSMGWAPGNHAAAEASFSPSFCLEDMQAALSAAANGAYPSSSTQRDYCEECGQQSLQLMPCTQCRIVCYCSRECQLEHWRAGHQKECNFLARTCRGMTPA